MKSSLLQSVAAISLSLCATVVASTPSKAGALNDGKYFGPEESFVVINGRLSKCYINGSPNYGSCAQENITATQVGPNAIRVRSSWGMNTLKCKGPLPAGKDAFHSTCTPTGWK